MKYLFAFLLVVGWCFLGFAFYAFLFEDNSKKLQEEYHKGFSIPFLHPIIPDSIRQRFVNENETKWVGHTILDKPFHQTCLVKVIEATSRDEAELKFDIYIEEQEKILGAKQRDKSAYAVEPLKKSIIKEHELKAFQP